MQITVESIGEAKKTQKGKDYCGISANGTWYNVIGGTDLKPGDMIDFDPKDYNGKQWAQGYKLIQHQAGGKNSGHGVSWDSYQMMMSLAHACAKELEPGEGDAQARAAIVNTVMIAFANGKIDYKSDDEDGAKDVPF